MIARDFESPADFNADNLYELSIRATDSDGNFDTEDWIVSVLDVIETTSFTIEAINDADVNENTVYLGEVPSITGTPIGTVTYTLEGTDALLFDIDASTGQVSMIARDFESPADFNSDNIYELNIKATDSDGNFDTEDWVVSVLDLTEATSFTIDNINDANVNENTPYLGVVPSINGTPIGTVTYTLEGTDALLFTINQANGQVSMIARDFESPVDFNADNLYELTIRATDGDDTFDIEAWNVRMLDVIEASSFTIDVIDDAEVNENSIYSSVLPSITGTPIGSVTYSLEGTDGQKFTINSATGQVSMIARDFESPVDFNADNIYELSIRAADSDGNFDTENWSVSVLNLIDVPIANDDMVYVNVDVSLNSNVSENDTISIDGGNIWTLITPPLKGTVFFNTDGSYVYTPDMSYLGSDSFTYKLSDVDGDSDEAKVTITVGDVLLPYQILTPNGDGNNDTFIVFGIDLYPKNMVTIYNRWGNVVYNKNGYQNDWDGNSNVSTVVSKSLPIGTYYYLIDYGANRHKTGFVYLDR